MVQAKKVLRPLNKGDCLRNHLTVTTPRHTSSLFEAQVPLCGCLSLGSAASDRLSIDDAS